MTQGRKKVEVGTLLLGNDKNIVIVNYLLSFFVCEVLGTKWLSEGLKSRINKLPKLDNNTLSIACSPNIASRHSASVHLIS